MTGTLRILHLLACILAVGTTPARAQPKSTMLAVASAGPRGEIGSLAEANEVRVVFSEPMVSLGRIPAGETAPFLRISPAVAGTFRWSGTTTLIFTPDPKHPLPFATRYEVTIAPSATAVSGRRLAEPYTFSFTTPTTRLLNTIWARRGGRADAPVVALLRFNQRVRPDDVLTHLRAEFEPHDWAEPTLSDESVAGMTAADPEAVARFRAKVAATRAVVTATGPAGFRLTDDWDKKATPPSPDLVAIESTTPIASESWVRLVLDERLPSPAGVAVPGTTQAYTVQVEPALFVRSFDCATRALAFEEGLTPASVLPDVPSHFLTAEAGVLYSPRNYDGRYRGPLLARRALAGSENVPAVALASHVGVPRLLRFLTRAGFSTFGQNASVYGLGVTLGNAEVRLDELVAAYAAFARGGRWLEPTWRRTQSDAQAAERPLVSPRTAFWITDILSDADAREYIFGRGGHLQFPFAVAVKTGTSQAYHDNWTIGYTREVTVGVWVGNFDRAPLRTSTGVTGAAPIFHAVMLAAAARVPPAAALMESRPILARPDGLLERDVCALSGMPASEWCPSRQREWLPPGGETPCSWHQLGDRGPLVEWPPAYRAWAAQHGLAADRSRARVASARARAPGARQDGPAITITNPPSGATYSIDPTLRREFQALALRAVTAGTSRVEWHVDDERLGSASSDASLMWPLRPGTHRILARDQQGRTAESTILVR